MKKIIIFTDGSYTPPDYAGIGVYFPKYPILNLSEPLKNTHKTNNRAELWAIIRALQVTKQNFNKQHIKIRIYTDSMLMVNTFNYWIHNWIKNDYKGKANVDLLKIAYTLINEFKDMKIRHTKAHQREPDKEKDYRSWAKWFCNKRADELAKHGSRK